MPADVHKTSSGSAKNDQYGKLYYHVVDLIKVAHQRVNKLDVPFQILNMDVRSLPKLFNTNGMKRFDRIEISINFLESWRLTHPFDSVRTS